jgi:hypothetical protein
MVFVVGTAHGVIRLADFLSYLYHFVSTNLTKFNSVRIRLHPLVIRNTALAAAPAFTYQG